MSLKTNQTTRYNEQTAIVITTQSGADDSLDLFAKWKHEQTVLRK